MAAFLDNCVFNATSTGTGDFVVASAATGSQTPASASAVNATIYRYYARSSDSTQWEIGYGAYTVAGTTLARTTVLFNSSGTTSKISFSTVPIVAIVALKEDIISIEEANSFTSAQQAQARANIAGAWTAFTPTVTPGSGAFTTVSASGGYFVFGKIVFFNVTITITTAGTAAGPMSIPLPTGTANRASVAFASETASVGFLGYGRIAAGGTTIAVINKYDNNTYIASGNVVTISGFYEQT
jgi:hypothetical protein